MRPFVLAAVCSLLATPSAAATLALVMENAGAVEVVIAPAGGFQGVPTPPLPTGLAPGERVRVLVESPYPGSAGGALRIGPPGRLCRVVIARLRAGPTGAWAWPTTRVEADAGVACSASVTQAAPGGDFEVRLRVE